MIAVSLTVEGAGMNATTIIGDAAGETGFGDRILDITGTGTTVALDGFTVRGGELPASDPPFTEQGAGISSVASTLELRGMRVEDNHAGVPSSGIFQTGTSTTLSIADSVITGNISESSAAGIGAVNASVVIRRSTISDNTSEANGGGIWVSGGFDVEDSTISGNVAGNDGGGLWADNVGGVMRNTTFSDNEAGDDGGALYLSSDAPSGATHVSFVGNRGTGVNSDGSAYRVDAAPDGLTIGSSLVADNRIAGSAAGQCSSSGDVSTAGNAFEEVVGQPSGCPTGIGDDTSPAYNVLPLASNGGPTMTHALPSTSAAIDTGPCVFDADQRGAPRPGGAACDSGAYERVECNGLAANTFGTSGDDTIDGTANADVMVGGAGADQMNGLGGNDKICGGEGNDVLKGGGGKDVLDGGDDTDRCVGGPGKDRFKGCEKKKG